MASNYVDCVAFIHTLNIRFALLYVSALFFVVVVVVVTFPIQLAQSSKWTKATINGRFKYDVCALCVFNAFASSFVGGEIPVPNCHSTFNPNYFPYQNRFSVLSRQMERESSCSQTRRSSIVNDQLDPLVRSVSNQICGQTINMMVFLYHTRRVCVHSSRPEAGHVWEGDIERKGGK